MKKIISLILVCVLFIGCTLTLASCGKKLSGKYESALGTGAYYEFSGNKMTYSRKSLFGGKYITEGTYEITEDEDGNTVIILTYDSGTSEEDAKSGSYSFSEGVEDGTEYIKISGVRYNKVD